MPCRSGAECEERGHAAPRESPQLADPMEVAKRPELPRMPVLPTLSGLERLVLEAAAIHVVLEEVESACAVGAVYRRLDREGLVAAEWWSDDALPLEVGLTVAGRVLLRRS